MCFYVKSSMQGMHPFNGAHAHTHNTYTLLPPAVLCCAASVKGTSTDTHAAAMALWLLRTLWYSMLASGALSLNLRGSTTLYTYAKHIPWTTLLFNIILLVCGNGNCTLLLCCPCQSPVGAPLL